MYIDVLLFLSYDPPKIMYMDIDLKFFDANESCFFEGPPIGHMHNIQITYVLEIYFHK